jgi:maltooligosyltrehalose trehalohydrolase
VGAEWIRDRAATDFRVWAPDHQQVAVVDAAPGAEPRSWSLTRDDRGYFTATIPGLGPGSRYWFQLGESDDWLPDPASRFQPEGVHGPSEIVDPAAFEWSDANWRGIPADRHVLYEMHVGTFTREGTWRAALRELPALAELGVTTLELMPVAEFDGQRGWGYDGVCQFAPTHLYGRPDDLRALVDGSHQLGLAVILDVVYNHLGPSGNYLPRFTRRYISTRYQNEWGAPVNYDDDAAGVRELIVANASYWIDEFHMDGLRLDATHQIFDASDVNVMSALIDAARRVASHRQLFFVAENERQDARLLAPVRDGGHGFDAMWNDDFHHAAVVSLTGRREAYYTDYGGTPQEFLSLAKWGFLFQGQRYKWQGARRGSPALHYSPRRFVTFLENHDQVANTMSGRGERLLALSHPAQFRAVTALWLMLPGLPMFFQGQELGARAPFTYFCDHGGELGEAVTKGRREFMSQFRSAGSRADVYDPNALASFVQCQLGPRAEWADERIATLHRDLLRLRREDPHLNGQRGLVFDGAVLSPHAFVIRWLSSSWMHAIRTEPDTGSQMPTPPGDRLLVANLGPDTTLDPAPEPLLAPPFGATWTALWSSEDPAYGGTGTPSLETEENWQLPGYSVVFLQSVRSS